MIAQVVPIKRLPLDMNYFDYAVPDKMQSQLKVGQIVNIPWRNGRIQGIVLHLKSETEFEKVKPINKLYQLFIQPWQVELIPKLAQQLHISYSQAAYSFMPGLALRKVNVEFEDYQPLNIKNSQSQPKLPKLDKKNYINYTTHEQKIKFYLQLCQQAFSQVVIISPDIKSAENIYKYMLSQFDKQQVALISGHLNKGQATYYWQQIFNQHIKIIIGTRKSWFYPFAKQATLIIDQSGDMNHKQADQHPRFHIFDLADMYAQANNADLIYTGALPTAQTYYHIKQQKFKYLRLQTDSQTAIHFQVSQDFEWQNDFTLSPIEASLDENKPVLVLVNRLSHSSSVHCRDCNYIFNCQNCELPFIYDSTSSKLRCYHCRVNDALPLTCPECGSKEFRYQGLGTQKIKHQLQQRYKQANIQFFTAADKQLRNDVQIVVATTAILPYMDEYKIGKAVIPVLEQFLTPVDIYTQWQTVYLLQLLKSYQLETYVQSFGDYKIEYYLQHLHDYLNYELKNLQQSKLNPFAQTVKLIVKHKHKQQARLKAEKIKTQLENKFNLNISAVYPANPLMQDNKYRYNILIHEITHTQLDKIVRLGYADTVFDINPLKLLS